MKLPAKPVLIYDGDCGFCRRWIERWRRATGDRVDYVAYQEVGADFPEISKEQFARALHLVEPDGRWSHGAEAVYRSLARAPGRRWLLFLYQKLPGFAVVSELCYSAVARYRSAFTRLTSWILGRR